MKNRHIEDTNKLCSRQDKLDQSKEAEPEKYGPKQFLHS